MTLTKHERKERLGYGWSTRCAAELGLSIGHVAQVVRGQRRDPRVEAAVAETLHLPVEQAFPEFTYPFMPRTQPQPAA